LLGQEPPDIRKRGAIVLDWGHDGRKASSSMTRSPTTAAGACKLAMVLLDAVELVTEYNPRPVVAIAR
jgi:hypothetical protein